MFRENDFLRETLPTHVQGGFITFQVDVQLGRCSINGGIVIVFPMEHCFVEPGTRYLVRHMGRLFQSSSSMWGHHVCISPPPLSLSVYMYTYHILLLGTTLAPHPTFNAQGHSFVYNLNTPFGGFTGPQIVTQVKHTL